MAEMMTSPGPVQDDGAIAAIILYTCAECAKRGTSLDVLGINEALFAVDRDRYLTTGKPLTGFRYLKSPCGFLADGLESHVARLIANGEVRETRYGEGDECFIYYSPGDNFVHPDESQFNDGSLRSLNSIIDEICTLGSWELVRRCYSSLAWSSFDHGDYLAWGILLVTEFHSRPPNFLALDRQAM